MELEQRCTDCETLLPISCFYIGDSICKSCWHHEENMPWFSLYKNKINSEKRKIRSYLLKYKFQTIEFTKAINSAGFEADHIIPINGKDVCGLSVPWNLQPLTKSENSKKGSWFDAEVYAEWVKSKENTVLLKK